MPNLERQAVMDWFTELQPDDHATWPPAVRPVEVAGHAPDRLAAIGAALDNLVPNDLEQLGVHLRQGPLLTDMRAIMPQLGAARALRLLHWLAEVEVPECNDVIVALTQGQDANAKALRATVETITRVATVRRMFAPERIAALEIACSTVRENDA